MADEDDVARLNQDESDMVGADLRDGVFKGMNLSSRDFTKSKLGKAKFLECNLSGCDFRSADLAMTSFAGSQMKNAKLNGALFRIDFSGANLSGAIIDGLIASCNFNGADLRGADFSGSRITEAGTSFDGAHFNAVTNFDGVEALRQYTKDPIFQNYSFSKGRFHRAKAGLSSTAARSPEAAKTPVEEPTHLATEHGGGRSAERSDRLVPDQGRANGRLEQLSFDLYEPFVVRGIKNAADEAKDKLSRLIGQTADEIVAAEPPGSNYPPPDILISEEERRHVFDALDLASTLDASDGVNRAVLLGAGEKIARVAAQIASWVGAKFDRAADSFAEATGTTVAKIAMYYAAYQLMSGQLFTLANALLKALGGG